MKAARILLVGILLTAGVAMAQDAETEIEYLLSEIGASGCTFVRNGDSHSAEDAEDHLRTKYRRGKRYADTAEKFIERLASKSSISRKPYWIQCPGEARVESGAWLFAKLADLRASD